MQGRKEYSEKLFINFQLSSRIPKTNFYRRLNEQLDLTFLYKETKDLYGNTGNPSIDPIVFFKLALVGYLENVVSDRKLMEHCAMRMDILYFLGYDIDEDLPWHSTLSRTRQLYPEKLFEGLFDRIFSLCVATGMVAGHTQAVDSALIKANASMDSLILKQPAESLHQHILQVSKENPDPYRTVKRDKSTAEERTVTAPEHQIERVKRQQKGIACLGAKQEGARLLSNKTHYSPTDPDARIAVKPGKARRLNYHCNLAVDTAHGVISHVQADFADKKDSQALPEVTVKLHRRLENNELRIQNFLADTGYSNGANYEFLEQRKITGWIPVFGKYKHEIEGFPYNKESDSFICQAGKSIPFKNYDKTQDGGLLKIYRAAYKDCKTCPFKSQCTPKMHSKQITRTAYDEQYQRAYQRQHSRQGRQMKRLRHSTVEPVFGNLIEHFGLRKIGVHRKAGAHKVMLMAAIAFNLKKYMKWSSRKISNSRKMAKKALIEALSEQKGPFFQFLVLSWPIG